jgi:subtilase family serine protease
VPNVAPGWYYTGVIIDPGNDVPETDETNNSGSDVNPRLVQ